MPGISVPVVLDQLQRAGFCALDLYGVVREFAARPPPEPDGSATELLREDMDYPETRAVKPG